jgi:hypothetical protein
MITSVAGLQQARSRWLNAGRDPKLFDTVITALEVATTNIDVRKCLPSPTFAVKPTKRSATGDAETWQIDANGELMPHYRLREESADADVTVLP